MFAKTTLSRFSLLFMACFSVGEAIAAIPENGELDNYATQGWTCKVGYIQSNKECVVATEIEIEKWVKSSAEQARQRAIDEKKWAAEERKRATEEQRQLAAEERMRATAEQRQLALFRAGLKVEFETNCGPVIEVRGSLVKIYSAVKDYGNEHWIRRNELYPTGNDCWFSNGRYVGTRQP